MQLEALVGAGCCGNSAVLVGWLAEQQVGWLGTEPISGMLERVTRAKVVLARRCIVLRTLSTLRICMCGRGSFGPFCSEARREVMSVVAMMLPLVVGC